MPPVAVVESVRVVRSPVLPEIEILVIDGSSRGWRVYHEAYTLAAARVTHRVADVWYRGRSYPAEPNVALVMEPGEMHVTRRVYAPASLHAVDVDAAFVAGAAVEMGIDEPVHIRTPQCSLQLNDALLALCASAERQAPPLEQKTLLYDCLALAFRHCGEAPVPELRLDRRAAEIARDYLHAYATEPITLDELADVSGVSRFHLVRTFHAIYGLPPHAYQNALRVAKARQALRAGVPPAHVQVGFADQSHLTRFFKRALSITPGEYART
jgi:AraC-like DNA-binding protein